MAVLFAAVDNQRVGQGRGVLGEVETVARQGVERVEGGRRLAGDAEGIEDEDLAEGPAPGGR